MSATPITAKEMAQDILRIVDETTAEFYPEEERERAKAMLLNGLSAQFFGMSMREQEQQGES